MSDFKALKAAYIALSGKNPPPMSADALRAKVDELAAAAAIAPAQEGDTGGIPAEGAAPSAGEAPVPDEPQRPADEEAAEGGEVEAPVAEQEQADGEPAADEPVEAVEDADPEQSVEEACAELGIEPDAEGNVTIELLVSLAGVNVKAQGEPHPCDAAEAVRMIRAGFAKARS